MHLFILTLPSNLFYKSHQIPNLKCVLSHLAVNFVQAIEARYQAKNEDVVGAAPTDGYQATSEWSTSLLPTNVPLISDIWQ